MQEISEPCRHHRAAGRLRLAQQTRAELSSALIDHRYMLDDLRDRPFFAFRKRVKLLVGKSLSDRLELFAATFALAAYISEISWQFYIW